MTRFLVEESGRAVRVLSGVNKSWWRSTTPSSPQLPTAKTRSEPPLRSALNSESGS